MEWVFILLVALYAVASFGLLLYGLNCYVLVVLFMRHHRKDGARRRAFVDAFWSNSPELPFVTTQLPLFNERFVAERLIRAVALLDWPRDRHEIQVLDDSTDETTELVARLVVELRASGIDIVHVRRPHRQGWKAGALQAGLEQAKGELVAIFDADFVPEPDFLRRTVPFFFDGERVAMVQTRWGFVNRDYSLLTRAEAIGMDGHFVVEQGARNGHGLFMNFNGTAGVWRKSAIEDAGGWRADTLTEDLDLSYRAQLAGWGMRYLDDVVTPSEIPVDINALKSQQHRWAKGSIQVARAMLPRVFRAPLGWGTKVQAVFHLTHYLIHPLIVIVVTLAWPLLAWSAKLDVTRALLWTGGIPFLLSVLAPSVLYLCSQRATTRAWLRRTLLLPALIAIGVGIAISNTRAVLEALFAETGDFERTPKYGATMPSRSIESKRRVYRSRARGSSWIELALGLYCVATTLAYAYAGRWIAVPLLALHAIGFTAVGAMGIAHALRARAT